MSEVELKPLQVHLPRPCTSADLFTVRNAAPGELEAVRGQIDEYLGAFAAPVRVEQHVCCFKCGGKFDGFRQALGLPGYVGFEWGLAHGEGHCSGCGWPMRAHHSVRDAGGETLLTVRDLPLAYLPSQVEMRGSQAVED